MRQPSLHLAVPLPTLGAGQYYRLLHVGAATHLPSDELTITGYFQPWQQQPFLASASMPLARQIAIHRTESLFPGSLWDAQGVGQARPASCPTDQRLWYAGARPFEIVRLREAVDLTDLVPAAFWALQGDTWVAVVDHGTERVLIPCFEVLRALYYHAGERFIRYCFSQLPWSLLCRPALAPTPATGHRAQMYVAATRLAAPEACVLGGLLFDPLLLRTLNQAQAHWARAEPGQAVYAKTGGQLGRNVLWRAEGHAFAHGHSTCFWVASLTPVTSPYNFRWLLYHGLASNAFPLGEASNLPECSDLFSYGAPKTRAARPQPTGAVLFSTQSGAGPHATPARLAAAFRLPRPGVARGAAWARESANRPLVWFDATPVPFKVGAEPAGHRIGSRTDTESFARLLQAFTSAGHPINMLPLNNEAGHFGADVAVFPHQGFAPLSGRAYRHRVSIFQVAQVRFCEGLFFLLRFHHLPGVVLLCQKQNLGKPDDAEWTQLLHIVATTTSLADALTLRDRCKHLQQYATDSMAALVVRAVPAGAVSLPICQKFAEQTLTCFRRQLALRVGLLGRYPDGFLLAHKQRMEQALARQKMFRSPTTDWDRQVSLLWEFHYPPTGRGYQRKDLYDAVLAKLNT